MQNGVHGFLKIKISIRVHRYPKIYCKLKRIILFNSWFYDQDEYTESLYWFDYQIK